MKVLILGISGMLGSALFRKYSDDATMITYGTVRKNLIPKYYDSKLEQRIFCNIDVDINSTLLELFEEIKPNTVINCIGLVKQVPEAKDPLRAIAINALFPHRLAALCKQAQARLIHISTDCVFSGCEGDYTESSFADANDLYGRSKFLGEVGYPHAITLRTSIIGHEPHGNKSLVDWFLTQEGSISGYRRALFSGLPTVELARVIQDYVMPNPKLSGLFHVSVNSISKYDLLNIVAKEYGKKIEIIPDDTVKIDRSLNSSKFRSATGYIAKEWSQLIAEMHAFG